MSDNYDVILAGSGHNGLVAAGYLAKAGQKVLVLERNAHFGGGVVTSEIAAPGYLHDWHSSLHVSIQANPLIRNDELGLLSQFGLKYIYPDALFCTVFDDNDSIVVYADMERTCESIARVSPRDAEAYRALAAEAAEVMPMLAHGMFSPPPSQGAMWAMLDQSPQGRKLMRVMQKSMLDIANEYFHHDKVKIHLLNIAAEQFVGPEEKGGGTAVFAFPAFVHRAPMGIPVGGSGMLTTALVRCLEHHGAELRTNADVEKVLVEQGRATGVRLAGGETIRAKTIIGHFHPWLLGDMVQDIDPGIARDARNTQASSFTAMSSFYAMKEAPKYYAGEDVGKVLGTNFITSSLEDFLRMFDDFRYGDISKKTVRIAALNLAQWDETRAPPGGATLAVYNYGPFNLRDGGSAGWIERKDEFIQFARETFGKHCSNFTDDNIVGSAFHVPTEWVNHSPTFQHGDANGIGKFFFQTGGHRPTPELAQYAVPGAEGLYLTGACMHPGGGVTGGGRATAMRICDDLKIDFDRLC